MLSIAYMTYENFGELLSLLLNVLASMHKLSRKRASIVYKSLHGFAPEHLELRETYRIQVKRLWEKSQCSITITKNSFFISYSGAILWNSLPGDLGKQNSGVI